MYSSICYDKRPTIQQLRTGAVLSLSSRKPWTSWRNAILHYLYRIGIWWAYSSAASLWSSFFINGYAHAKLEANDSMSLDFGRLGMKWRNSKRMCSCSSRVVFAASPLYAYHNMQSWDDEERENAFIDRSLQVPCIIMHIQYAVNRQDYIYIQYS